MKLCRFNEDRIGVVSEEGVRDATAALDLLPAYRWPFPQGDRLIAALPELTPAILRAAAASQPVPVADVRLLSPVANPTKIAAAPINYQKHIEEARADPNIAHGRDIKTIGDWGLFLKSTCSLVGPSHGVALRFTERRNVQEGELAVVIGRTADRVSRDEALRHVAGYCIGLDMTLRGPELPSWRKSIHSYTVLGPWLTTADEVPDPGDLDFVLSVNGKVRQSSNTRHLVYDVPRLIEFASGIYPLHPGDVILTGTPEGVGPVSAGDVIAVEFARIGRMEVAVADAGPPARP